MFLPQLRENVDSAPDIQSYLPQSRAARYLQAKYTTQTDDFDTLIQIDDAGDGSEWSRAHAELQPYLRDVVLRFGFDDMMLIDNDGRVVWTAYKGVDPGTNLETGPYSASVLADAFRETRAANDAAYVAVTDFEPYRASYALPTGFMLTSIARPNGKLVGVLAVQLPEDQVEQILTGDRRWNRRARAKPGNR